MRPPESSLPAATAPATDPIGEDDPALRILPAAPASIEARFSSISELGRGGQGRVMVAQDLVLRRQVALKTPLRTDDPSLRRFEREALFTARLQHPGIVSVYELVRGKGGELVLVMRRVQGQPFDERIAEAASFEQRLALLPQFVSACDALAYAHQQGVIHRDVKPSNVLLGQFGDTVVIDWGLAKEVGAAELPDASAALPATGLTAAGAVIGTPGFMSPEQARGEAADPRSDVYALGAMLYQLLAGRPAFEGDAAETLEATRTRGPVPIAQILPQLAPELITIVGRAMALDKTARYASAVELSAELKLFSTGRLIRSHNYSLADLLWRWVRRNAALIAVCVASLLMLAVGAVLSVRRILVEKERANREAGISRRVSEFMTGMFRISNPNEARGKSVPAREILDRAAREIETERDLDPQVRARLMVSMGTVYSNLGLYQQAEVLLDKGATQLTGAEALQASIKKGILLWREEKLPAAEKLMRETLDQSRATLGPDSETTIEAEDQLGVVISRSGRQPEAAQLLAATFDNAKRVLGPDNAVTLDVMSNLGTVYSRADQPAEAEKIERELIAILTRVQGPDHPDTLKSDANLAVTYAQIDRLEDARLLLSKVLDANRRIYGEDHPETLLAGENLAGVLYRMKRYAEVEPLVRARLAGYSRRLGPDSSLALEATNDLAALMMLRGRTAEAASLFQKTYDTQLRLHGPKSDEVAGAMADLAAFAAHQGDKERALKLLGEALDRGNVGLEELADPLFAPLHGDPRFAALQSRAKKQ